MGLRAGQAARRTRHNQGMEDLAPGRELAGCRVEGVAGRGGMGVVYRGTDLRLDRPVAIKLIAPDRASDQAFRERFEREARQTAAIDHPNVIPVYAAGEEDGHLYLVMRYVGDTDLRRLLRDEQHLPATRAAAVIAQVASALDAAHAAGLVHRDVKPANVLLTADDHVYLSDFGITRSIDAETQVTDSGEWVGTVDFMAPEHLSGKPVDARSDVYALGCVLFMALTGAPPFRRETVAQTITAHLHQPPPRASTTAGVPVAFDGVLARALAKRPQDRYPSAGDLGRAALAAARGQVPASHEHSVARGEAAPDPHTAAARARLIDPGDASTSVLAGERDQTSATKLDDGSRSATDRAIARGEVPNPPPPAPKPPERTARLPGETAKPRDIGRVQPRRKQKAAAAAVATPAPTPARRRRVPIELIVAAILLAAAVMAYGLSTAGGSSAEDPAAKRLSPSDVRSAADAFARAYTREDEAALQRLLAPDVKRVTPGSEQDGRAAVIKEYSGQFAASQVERYGFADLRVSAGNAGRAAGRYEVTRKGRPPINGTIVLGVERGPSGKPRIALIAAEPSA